MKQKVAEIFNLIFGFRKTLAWFSLLLIAIIFRVKDLIDGKQFVELMTSTFAGFITGNLAEHAISFGKDYMASKTPQVADTDPTNDEKEVTPIVEG